MANITVYEFIASPVNGEVSWPADTTGTSTSGSTYNLGSTTRAVVICADGDCRAQVNASGASTAASTSSLPILGVVPNQLVISAGAGQTLKFT